MKVLKLANGRVDIQDFFFIWKPLKNIFKMRYQNIHKKHFKKYLVPEQQRLRNKWEELHHPPQCGMERPCFLDGSTIWKHRYTPICSWARDCISTPVGSIYVMGTQAGCGLSCMAFARSWADKAGTRGRFSGWNAYCESTGTWVWILTASQLSGMVISAWNPSAVKAETDESQGLTRDLRQVEVASSRLSNSLSQE